MTTDMAESFIDGIDKRIELKKTLFCDCSYPIDQANGTSRCVTCNKEIGLLQRIKIYAQNLDNRERRAKNKQNKI